MSLGFGASQLFPRGRPPGGRRRQWCADDHVAAQNVPRPGTPFTGRSTTVREAAFRPDGQCTGEPNAVAWSAAHWRNVRGGMPRMSDTVSVT
jgi:hypothetical protein